MADVILLASQIIFVQHYPLFFPLMQISKDIYTCPRVSLVGTRDNVAIRDNVGEETSKYLNFSSTVLHETRLMIFVHLSGTSQLKLESFIFFYFRCRHRSVNMWFWLILFHFIIHTCKHQNIKTITYNTLKCSHDRQTQLIFFHVATLLKSNINFIAHMNSNKYYDVKLAFP